VAFLIDVARTLNQPIQATEQYPKGLGSTVPELARHLPRRPEKTAFSCCAIPDVVGTFQREGRPRVLLCGIETHVCVLHTALDLIAEGFRVYVAADAVASRGPYDHQIALERMRQAGVILTTAEGAAFELVGGAGHPGFKAVSNLVQERMKRMAEGGKG
jgi:nicotinamidase-related amidase